MGCGEEVTQQALTLSFSAGSNPAIPRDKCSNLHAVCLGNDFISANLSKDIDKFYEICYNIYRKMKP